MSDGATAYTEAEERPLAEFTERAYLDYSMYVVLDRALPALADGLKPVQRRIVYAMSELGLSAASKHKKSARTVGDVLGKFHPHGDQACYEAMVLMAQPFSFRYPLIEGQGNWGSQDDPKSFAAMRYTEARLASFAEVLLSELGQGTVDWESNFDGTLEEPRVLPARLPHVLLNGASGIAVGLATDIPSHNVRELATATAHLLDDPEMTTADLCEHLPGPDYPTEAEIVSSRQELRQIYETGSGSVRLRSRWEREGSDVVVTALPYQVSGSKVLTQIADQMAGKKLPWIDDLRDESDHENPTRLVIAMRSNRVDFDAIMEHLFATTDLERSYRVNMNVVGLDGRPRLYTLRDLLAEWLEFRLDTTRRRLEWRFERVVSRLHVLEGYLVAYLNIDEVIEIVRGEEEPKPALMERFALSDRQAEAVLDLRLRNLSKLEEIEIRGEQDELMRERDELRRTLDSSQALRALVRSELLATAEEHGDERRSPIVERGAAEKLSASELLTPEPVTVVLSQKGWVKAAKGHDTEPADYAYKSGDAFLHAARGKSTQQAVFVDSTGRSYAVPAHRLPSARGYGEPLTSSLSPPSGASFVGVVIGDDDERVLLASDAAYGFVTTIGDLTTKVSSGKSVMTLSRGGRALAPVPVPTYDEDLLAAVTDAGYLIVFPVAELPLLAKGQGLKILDIPKKRRHEERLALVAVLPPAAVLRVHAANQYTNLGAADLEAFRSDRALRGRKLPRGFRNPVRLEVVGDD